MSFKASSILMGALLCIITPTARSQHRRLNFQTGAQGSQAVRPRTVTEQKPELYVQTASVLSAIVYFDRYAENLPIALTGCCNDADIEIGNARKLS